MRFLAITLLSIMALNSWAARKKTPAKSIESLYESVENALNSYDIDAADEALDELDAALRRAKRSDEPRADQLRETKQLLETMLQRVESLRFLAVSDVRTDSLLRGLDIAVPLSADAGQWHGAEWFAGREDIPHDSLSIAHIPASGREIFWSAPAGDSRTIWQAGLLLDGTLDNPHKVFDQQDFDDDIDLNAPFLAADGLTLYFAGNIPGSTIGGQDIYRAVRMGVGEDFSAPTNMGMPYSSTRADALFAIDPESGLGYFATNRSHGDDEYMSLYTFMPNDERVNRDPEADDPTLNLTVADAIADFLPTTLPDGFDPTSLLKHSNNTEATDDEPAAEFTLYIPSAHRNYTSLDDFRNPAARQAMAASLETADALDALTGRLQALRAAYASGRRNLAAEIRKAETTLPQLRHRLQAQRNTAIRLESRPNSSL